MIWRLEFMKRRRNLEYTIAWFKYRFKPKQKKPYLSVGFVGKNKPKIKQSRYNAMD